MDIKKFVIIICIVIAIMGLRSVTGIGLLDIFRSLKEFILSICSKMAGKNRIKNKEKFSLMNKNERKKSNKYKFHSFVNEILLDLGWKNKKISVEGFNVFIRLIVLIFSIVLYFLTKSLFLTILISLMSWVVIYALVFLLSRMQHTYRKTALMDAEDFLCGSMSQGIVQAIEDNYKMMDKIIQPQFEDFLGAVYHRNMDVSTAIDMLNDKCGEHFDDFCEKAKTYEREKRPGMEDVFQYNISRNAYIRELDRECNKTFGIMNRNFLASISVIIGFILYNMMAYADIRAFYLSGFGKFLLALYFLLVSTSFIYIQYIQSKPFKFGK